MVQNVQVRSANSDPPRNPSAFLTCRRLRKALIAKNGRKRIGRTLNRVTPIKSIRDCVFPIWDDYLLLQHTELMQQGEIVPQSQMLHDLSGTHPI